MGERQERASRLRRELRGILDEQAQLEAVFFERGELVRGLVYESQRRCGKPSCRCATGEPHRQVVFAARTNEGQKHRSLSAESRKRIAPLAASYRRFREARAALVRVHKRILACIDAIEEALTMDLDIDQLKD